MARGDDQINLRVRRSRSRRSVSSAARLPKTSAPPPNPICSHTEEEI
jgi:hypothetical protein